VCSCAVLGTYTPPIRARQVSKYCQFVTRRSNFASQTHHCDTQQFEYRGVVGAGAEWAREACLVGARPANQTLASARLKQDESTKWLRQRMIAGNVIDCRTDAVPHYSRRRSCHGLQGCGVHSGHQ
jgi:hypothetical protein